MIFTDRELRNLDLLLTDYSISEGWIVAEELLKNYLELLRKRRDGDRYKFIPGELEYYE